MDAIDEYLDSYDAVKDLESDLREANKRKSKAKDALLEYLSAQGLSSAGRGNRTLTTTQICYAKVDDFDLLRDWVDAQGEPRSEYMEEVFRKKQLNEIAREVLKDAAMGGESKMPPGLGSYIQHRVTVRGGKIKDEMYDELMGRIDTLAKSNRGG